MCGNSTLLYSSGWIGKKELQHTLTWTQGLAKLNPKGKNIVSAVEEATKVAEEIAKTNPGRLDPPPVEEESSKRKREDDEEKSKKKAKKEDGEKKRKNKDEGDKGKKKPSKHLPFNIFLHSFIFFVFNSY
jgi:hypothetical protein